MRVFYHSALIEKELERDSVFRTVPDKAYLRLERERGEQDELDILLDGRILDSNIEKLDDIKSDTELVIRTRNGIRQVYAIKPLVRELSNESATAYEQFHYEYMDKTESEIESIRNGSLKMYAVEQNAEVYDWTESFDKIENAFKSFKSICEKPVSHLKAINEVRPIETVKRIGYESIPYLAAHSEDWLARTASGLKPARLFSRVEDDEYQIYENRVVKTLIDLVLSFLRKKEKELKDQYEQLHSIMNSSVQTGSFGFDVGFQKAVAELISSDAESDNKRTKALELAEKLHKRSKLLLKKYRTLRTTRLYRYLKKSKPISNPLNETNILLMDKNYNEVFVLWKEMHRLIAVKQATEEKILQQKYSCDDYLLYCKVLCGYAAHVLNFKEKNDGYFVRPEDSLSISIEEQDGLIRVVLADRKRRVLEVPKGLQIPITPGSTFDNFSYDGKELSWENTVNVDEIERFCSQFKTRDSRGREQAEEQKKYLAIKQAIIGRQNEYPAPKQAKMMICPAVVTVESDTRNHFKEFVISSAEIIAEREQADYVVIALPQCGEDEQKIVEYAKYEKEKVLIFPLSMFDINSFRRLQNVLLRMILLLDTGRCPTCGNIWRERGNQFVCNNCYDLIMTKTICPVDSCKKAYYYLGYDTSEDTVLKMQCVDEDNFYQVDSLFQYKDVVPMSVESGKLKTICPHCHQ